MNSYKGRNRDLRDGAVLIIAVIFVALFSSLGLAILTMSSNNVQMADNHHEANTAFAYAESGLEVTRYWLSRINIPNSTSPSDNFATVISCLQDNLATNNISNIVLGDEGSISSVSLGTADGGTFSAQLQTNFGNPAIIPVSVTGNQGQITRTIQANFNITSDNHPIFDYGLATRGSMKFFGNPTLEGINNLQEAAIYIESQNDDTALLVTGNTNFDGDINIGNANSNAQFDGDVLIGGDEGQAAIDNHVFIGADNLEFPVPDTGHFLQYATGLTIDSSTNTTDSMTLTNAVIEAGTNPCFSGNVEIEGVLFIESPNIVTFDGNADIKGLIIGDGDADNPGSNSLTFNGNFESTTFPESGEFDAIRSETGSSMLAPGFVVRLAGNFASLGGVMAVSGFHLSGNANALVSGSIINYSNYPTIVEGNAILRFDRSGGTSNPAGFDSIKILEYDASSYSLIY
ncbi:MAG: pilus assembly PilX N-terminal domain-containing protein [Planctomycetota bacterium]|jgi:hypothetical protein